MPVEVAVAGEAKGYKVTVTGRGNEVTEVLHTLNATIEIINGDPTYSENDRLTTVDLIPPTLTSVTKLSEAVGELFRSSWGKTPRRMSEVRDALATNGLNYPPTTLSGTLLGLTKRGILRRLKTTEGYQYVQGAPR